jgi:hypothetical protein
MIAILDSVRSITCPLANLTCFSRRAGEHDNESGFNRTFWKRCICLILDHVESYLRTITFFGFRKNRKSRLLSCTVGSQFFHLGAIPESEEKKEY